MVQMTLKHYKGNFNSTYAQFGLAITQRSAYTPSKSVSLIRDCQNTIKNGMAPSFQQIQTRNFFKRCGKLPRFKFSDHFYKEKGMYFNSSNYSYSTKVDVSTHAKRFKQITRSDVEYFKSILPSNGVLISEKLGGSHTEHDLEKYNTGWEGEYIGHSNIVLLPENTQQISGVLKYCNTNNIPVVPQGGNSGVYGGANPVFDEVILCLSNMNKVRSFDSETGVLIADAGCILEHLDDYAKENGYIMPIDLGGKGSCHIGGNVSTNAGGVRYIRYGTLHESVLGLEVVLPDGSILDTLSTNLHHGHKNVVTFDTNQLFIGAEGTLGIVAAVKILTKPRPQHTSVSILALDSFEDVRATFKFAREKMNEVISAFEFWDQKSLELVVENLNIQNPFPAKYHNFYILLETSGSNALHDREKLESFFQDAMEKSLVQDGVIAQDESQINKFWQIRERMIRGINIYSHVHMYDISMPIEIMYSIVGKLKNEFMGSEPSKLLKECNPNIRYITGFGHMGDGNLHLNVATEIKNDEFGAMLNEYIFSWCRQNGCSISAEHGLGVAKPSKLFYSKSQEVIDIMKKVKCVFDPKGILNPYKVLPM